MDKICNLYISDEHLLITLSNYLKKEIDSGTKVIILSQNNIKQSIRDIKDKIANRTLKDKVEYINSIDTNLIKDTDNVTIILKGDNNYIYRMEKKLKEIFSNNDTVSIVSCYNINENKNVNNIIKEYNKMLNTSGIIGLK